MLARLFIVGLLTTSMAQSAAAQSAPASPAVPVEPIAAILDAFRSHDVVALPMRTAMSNVTRFCSR